MQLLQTTYAIAALIIGILVYVFFRQPESIYFIPDGFIINNAYSHAVSSLTDHLPTFIHVFSFILLTAVISGSNRHIKLICITWLLIDSLFEIAQYDAPAEWLAHHTPSWFSFIPVLENTKSYFRNGTFDLIDLLSIAAGTLAAYLLLRYTYRKQTKHPAHI